jgi:hypothetical protein
MGKHRYCSDGYTPLLLQWGIQEEYTATDRDTREGNCVGVHVLTKMKTLHTHAPHPTPPHTACVTETLHKVNLRGVHVLTSTEILKNNLH